MKFFLSRYVVSVALTVSLGTLLCAARGAETKSLEDFPSTPHFWYRPQPPGPSSRAVRSRWPRMPLPALEAPAKPSRR